MKNREFEMEQKKEMLNTLRESIVQLARAIGSGDIEQIANAKEIVDRAVRLCDKNKIKIPKAEKSDINRLFSQS